MLNSPLRFIILQFLIFSNFNGAFGDTPLPLTRFNLPEASTSYVSPSGETKNLKLPLKESHARKLAWMCAAFRDFPHDYQGELRFLALSDQRLVLQIPPDVGVNTKQIWLLANEVTRAEIPSAKGEIFYENTAATGTPREKKITELANAFVSELQKRHVNVTRSKKLDQALPAESKVVALVKLPALAPTFRSVIDDESFSDSLLAQTLRASFVEQHLAPPPEALTVQDLNDCIGRILANFQTAPEFLTLIPAAAGPKGIAERRMARSDSDGYFLFTVLQSNQLLKYALLTAKEVPSEQKKFETEFPF